MTIEYLLKYMDRNIEKFSIQIETNPILGLKKGQFYVTHFADERLEQIKDVPVLCVGIDPNLNIFTIYV